MQQQQLSLGGAVAATQRKMTTLLSLEAEAGATRRRALPLLQLPERGLVEGGDVTQTPPLLRRRSPPHLPLRSGVQRIRGVAVTRLLASVS